MEPYRSYFPHSRLLLPETEKLVNKVLVLPTGQAIGPDDISVVCSIIRVAIANADGLRKNLIQAL